MIQSMRTKQVDERALLARLADRDTAAFALLYDRHAAAIFGYAVRLLGAAAAEAIVEDAFLALWRGAPDAVPPGVAVRA